MADMTVEALAKVLKISCRQLLEHLKAAGVDVDGPDDTVSEEAKLTLLGYLREKKAGEPSVRITLTRR